MEPAFGIVGVDDLAALWPRVEPLVAEAMSYSTQREWPPGEVLQRLQAGEWKLVTVADGAELIGVQVFGRGTNGQGQRFVEVICCAGQRMQEWMPDMVRLGKELAELLGAERVLVQGRPGWARVLRGWGLRVQSISAGAAVADINVKG